MALEVWPSTGGNFNVSLRYSQPLIWLLLDRLFCHMPEISVIIFFLILQKPLTFLKLVNFPLLGFDRQ